MSSTYSPCSFFDEPIITSHGVIFGLETNGNFITGNLPPVIQAAYLRNNQVPYMPFTNINQNSPSYVTDKQRMEAYERITKYNLPAVTLTSKAALTFNTHNTPAIAPAPAPAIAPAIAPASASDSIPISREQELELERIIINQTGINPMSCKTYAEYTDATKQIKELVKLSIAKGLDNAIVDYNTSIAYSKSSVPEYATVPAQTSVTKNTLTSIRNRLKLIDHSHVYGSLGESSESEYKPKDNFSSIRNRLKLIGHKHMYGNLDDSSVTYSLASASSSDSSSDSSSANSSGSSSVNSSASSNSTYATYATYSTDYEIQSLSDINDSNDEHITHVGCVINFVTKDGKRYYVLGMNSSNVYSIITQKVFVNDGIKESSITTVTKLLNTHFPSINVAINNTTHFIDKKVSGNNYRIYQIYVNEFDVNDNNKKVSLLKSVGINVVFTNFKLVLADNMTKSKIINGDIQTIENEKIKIDYTTKNIFIN